MDNLERANKFKNSLPSTIKKVDTTPCDDGSVLLEWYKKEQGEVTIYSIVFEEDYVLFSLYNGIMTKNYGKLSYCEANMQKLTPDLVEHFTVS